MTININFETKQIIRFFIIATAFVAAAFGLYRMYGALVLIATSLFLAVALNPAVNFLSRFMPWKKRGPAIAIVFIIVILALGFLFASILPPVIKETSSFVESLPRTIESLSAENSQARNVINKYHLGGVVQSLSDTIQAQLQSLGGNTISSVGSVTASFFNVVTVIVMTVLMLTGGKKLLRDVSKAVYRNEDTRKHHMNIMMRMYRIVTGYALGQVSVAIIGSLCALGVMLLLKIPYALPLALIIFLFALIPLVGTTLGAITVSLFALILKDPTTALIMIVFFIIYQQIENATLQPIVQSRTSQMPPLAIFIAVILGIGLFGPIGGIFAIPVAGCIKILVNDYLKGREDSEVIETAPNIFDKLKRRLAKAK